MHDCVFKLMKYIIEKENMEKRVNFTQNRHTSIIILKNF